ncbi:cell wall biogenesis protein Mhp1 [Cordyceps fumosorosea ARSEF 2679]|uniref:Cell wall biogenesis protein Mhp1 n=1 Tax=Cordyceps fumosorosea (strain ARSEF 2679) TaxID=1081104 RepID=A0A167JTA0_CORFA|nr:cell wall biogenesis protein Mhp1 [Cordyceps fumosorosea ARSEF 2679]OAA50722.1 cell wall biogenesis protein Mhp1 [Cordyceps fumosorosea ARSEF 2679]
MEQVHGVDVSWMTPGSSKGMLTASSPFPSFDKLNKSSSPPKANTTQPRQIPTPSNGTPSHQRKDSKSGAEANVQPSTPLNGGSSLTKRLSRSSSVDKQPAGPNGTPPGRRNTWFSNISAKFSGSSPATNSPQSPTEQTSPHNSNLPYRTTSHEDQGPTSPQASEPPVPKISPSRNAVLQHGAKPEGSGPYTPAPPKSGQAGILNVFRRLSSSSSANGATTNRLAHGLVERTVLNKDKNRERCNISELKAAKLRRVAFCVDVEIAPMPKYANGEVATQPIDKSTKKKLTEKGEGEALKSDSAVMKEENFDDGKPEPVAEAKTNGHANGPADAFQKLPSNTPDANDSPEPDTAVGEKEMSKKKEKKKRSEEERKARKEKRRKLAEDSGSIPVEIHYDSPDSSDSGASGTIVTSSLPTTNPARIYRRCCQLRETPILKKITEQLTDPTNLSHGVVSKLDLTGYWLQLADLVTLGDYLAVVPVREVLLENIGLTDEGLRVVLAGLLAAKPPTFSRKKPKHEQEVQGGIVERLVLKNNKIGPDGWKHLSLFIYLCKSIKSLDISHIAFPRQAVSQVGATLPNGQHIPRSIADIFATSIGDRLGGPTLEMINIGETEPSMEQLGVILDGMLNCKVKRLGLAHNHLDEQGISHVTRYISSGICEGLDLAGNDLRGHEEKLASALKANVGLWALSLAGCELGPSSLSKILPVLANMPDIRFVDLSHNKELFQSRPSAVGLLRRYLPKCTGLKRIHLSDVSMNSEQAIALVEVLPEIQQLAHINLLENEELVKLAHAKSEEAQEEACALYASLMAAARVSKTIVAIDIDVPHDEAGEIVKAMAKQVVAYCLRNMEAIPDTGIGAAMAATLSESNEADDSKPAGYSDVIMHLVGHDVMQESDEEDNSSAPDEDYVIGGTGVVKALKCCLENRGDESQRQSGEFSRDAEATDASLASRRLATGGKAKDMSKHLLAGARKIRLRLQPALIKAKANPGDEMTLRKLTFLDETLQGIINRFEDEYPDTRETSELSNTDPKRTRSPSAESVNERARAEETVVSDGEDEGEIRGSRLSRSNSTLSKVLAEEEGRVHRAGHRFRVGMVSQMQMRDLVASIDDIGADPRHVRMLTELAEDVGGDFWAEVQAKGVIQAYKDNRESLLTTMKASDPDGAQWERFVESQKKALANRTVPSEQEKTLREAARAADENAIAD